MHTVLLVEDDAESQRLTRRALGHDSRVIVATTVEEGLAAVDRHRPDVILLDLNLPDGDGFDLLARLESSEKVPVLFLSGRGDTAAKVTAFSCGADDFIEKPFSPLELRARVEARIRKHADSGRRRSRIECDGVVVDLELHHAALVSEGREEPLDLTPLEYRLLHGLLAHAGRVLDRRRLGRLVWGDLQVAPRTIDTHVSNLRRKLGDFSSRVEGIRGVGYRFRASG